MSRQRDYYMPDISKDKYKEVSSHMDKAIGYAENKDYSKATTEVSKFLHTSGNMIPKSNDSKTLDSSNVGEFVDKAKEVKYYADHESRNHVDLEGEKLAKFCK